MGDENNFGFFIDEIFKRGKCGPNARIICDMSIFINGHIKIDTHQQTLTANLKIFQRLLHPQATDKRTYAPTAALADDFEGFKKEVAEAFAKVKAEIEALKKVFSPTKVKKKVVRR